MLVSLSNLVLKKQMHDLQNSVFLSLLWPSLFLILFCDLYSEGVVELWLTSEDTGAYGKDIGVTLPELLWQLVDVIPDGARMRIGMTNPPYILEHLEVFGEPFNSDDKHLTSL